MSMSSDISTSTQFCWMTPGQPSAYLTVFGGENQRRGLVSFVGGEGNDPPTPPHGVCVCYKDTADVMNILIGFHHKGDEGRIKTHHLHCVSPGIYRDEYWSVLLVVLTCPSEMQLSVASPYALHQEALQVRARISQHLDLSDLAEHIFEYYHPGRPRQFLIVTHMSQVIYVSDIDFYPVTDPHGCALYDAWDPGHWGIHFHHLGPSGLPTIQPTLYARLAHPRVPVLLDMIFRAVGAVKTTNQRDEFQILPHGELTRWHIVLRELE